MSGNILEHPQDKEMETADVCSLVGHYWRKEPAVVQVFGKDAWVCSVCRSVRVGNKLVRRGIDGPTS